MIEASHSSQQQLFLRSTLVQEKAKTQQFPLLRNFALFGVLGMLILLPVRAIELPLHMAPVELWNVVALPCIWLYLIHMRQPVSCPYGVAMWIILLGSFIGIFAAPVPFASLVVIIKELYVYVWFATLVALFCSLKTDSLHFVMHFWSSVVIVHGAIVVAQFLFPPFFHQMIVVVSRFGTLDLYRPSGLFENANSTALFQLMGFAPVLWMGMSRTKTAILAVFLLCSILATGSMAATVGSVCGFTGAMLIIATIAGRPQFVIKMLLTIAIAALILGGVVGTAISQNAAYRDRFEYIFYGRAERSADGRFDLWQRGVDMISSGSTLLGLGPESFRYVDFEGTQLHNDILSFMVERGVIGTVGLLLFEAQALLKGLRMLLLHKRHPKQIGLAGAIFTGVIVGALVHSQFHQVFHDRSIWLVLALQEALLISYSAQASQLNKQATTTLAHMRYQAV